MKFLRKFNSVAALEAAIQTVEHNFIGLAYDSNNNSVVYHKKLQSQHPPKNLTISCSDNYVTISASNANTIQYRMDEGAAWSTYSSAFEIYESVTVYAKASNAYGEITGSQYCEYYDTSIPNDEIWYTTDNGDIIIITWPGGGGSGSGSGSGSGVTIVENTYEDGKGILKFSGDLTEIPDNTFYGYSQLTSITIPNSVTSIGDNAFNDCTGLTSITIPNNVTTIGQNAFGYCSGLTSVNLGSGVTSISYNAFSYCTGLTSITCEATTPPTLSSDALTNTNNCPIYVPSGSVSTYQAASGWSSYADRIQAIQ